MAGVKSLMEYASDKKTQSRNMVAGLPYLKDNAGASFLF